MKRSEEIKIIRFATALARDDEASKQPFQTLAPIYVVI